MFGKLRLICTFAFLAGVVFLIVAPAYSQSGDCATFREKLGEYAEEYEGVVFTNLTVESDPYDILGGSVTLNDSRQYLINMHSRGLPCDADEGYYFLMTVVHYQDYLTRILTLQSLDDPEQIETVEILANSALEAAWENYQDFQGK